MHSILPLIVISGGHIAIMFSTTSVGYVALSEVAVIFEKNPLKIMVLWVNVLAMKSCSHVCMFCACVHNNTLDHLN